MSSVSIVNKKNITIKEGESRDLLDLVTTDAQAQQNTAICIQAKKGARVTYILAIFDGQTVKRDVILTLEEGAEGRIIGIVLGDNKDAFELRTVLHHKGPHTIGDIKMRIVLKDSAYVSYDGMIKIAKTANQTNSYLSGKALALNRGVRCDAEPELEIEANDVKASHSFSQGQIDPEQLFYLRSRGLTEEEAKHMIVEGFLLDVLETLSKEVKEKVTSEIKKNF